MQPAGKAQIYVYTLKSSPRSDTVLTNKYSLSEVKGRENFSVIWIHANVPQLSKASELKSRLGLEEAVFHSFSFHLLINLFIIQQNLSRCINFIPCVI